MDIAGEKSYDNCSKTLKHHGQEHRNRKLGFWGAFKRIPGNVINFNILGNVQESSGKCSRRFRKMFKKIWEMLMSI